MIVALCLLIFAVGYAAKHGQFESAVHHGHFLSKSIKMEKLSHGHETAAHVDIAPTPLHFEALFFMPVAPASDLGIIPPVNLSLPILV